MELLILVTLSTPIRPMQSGKQNFSTRRVEHHKLNLKSNTKTTYIFHNNQIKYNANSQEKRAQLNYCRTSEHN